jgi:hypothetical protein
MKSIQLSKILLVAGFISLLAAIGLNAALLRQEVAKIDLKDPMRSYDKIPLDAFDHIVVEIGRPHDSEPGAEALSLEVAHESEPVLYVLKPLKDSVHWKLENRTLYLNGYAEDWTRSRAVSLRLFSPSLLSISSKASRVKVFDFKSDSLRISGNSSEFDLERISGERLDVRLDSRSTLTMAGGEGALQRLSLNLEGAASATLENVQVSEFYHQLSPESSLQLRGKTLEWVK